jgi:hypothetical protein
VLFLLSIKIWVKFQTIFFPCSPCFCRSMQISLAHPDNSYCFITFLHLKLWLHSISWLLMELGSPPRYGCACLVHNSPPRSQLRIHWSRHAKHQIDLISAGICKSDRLIAAAAAAAEVTLLRLLMVRRRHWGTGQIVKMVSMAIGLRWGEEE